LRAARPRADPARWSSTTTGGPRAAREILAPAGFEVVSAASGAAGLHLARTQPPDVIVLDLMMDEMDGYDVARELKLDRARAASRWSCSPPTCRRARTVIACAARLRPGPQDVEPRLPELLQVLNDVLARGGREGREVRRTEPTLEERDDGARPDDR